MKVRRDALLKPARLAATMALASINLGGTTFVSLETGSAAKSNLARQAPKLTAEEREGLLFMREEEKLARDVYVQLGKRWGGRPFDNIATAEQAHMDSVKALLDRYGIPDPADAKPGVFKNKELQKLYDALIEQGGRSRVEALKVGATIEDVDLYDLDRWLAKTKNDDIKRVYENLARGSRNHLRAFHFTLARAGGSYKPKYINQAEYDKIVNSLNERGGRGRGSGGPPPV